MAGVERLCIVCGRYVHEGDGATSENADGIMHEWCLVSTFNEARRPDAREEKRDAGC